ncbi:MAG: hypothetical protein KGI60_00220 [Patescibacteria group bacterium]|nr:hypothetical protein [Patescibacteria group bacterium]
MRQYFGIIAIIVIGGIAVYMALAAGSSSGHPAPFSFGSVNVQNRIASTTAAAGKLLTDQASTTMQHVTQQVNDAVGTVVNDAQTAVTNAIKDAVAQKLTQVAQSISPSAPAETGSPVSATTAAPDPVSIAVHSGTFAFFTIKNAESVDESYVIDWKDGTAEKGTIAAGTTKTVSHSWNTAGEYPISFTLTSSKGTTQNTVTISIL